MNITAFNTIDNLDRPNVLAPFTEPRFDAKPAGYPDYYPRGLDIGRLTAGTIKQTSSGLPDRLHPQQNVDFNMTKTIHPGMKQLPSDIYFGTGDPVPAPSSFNVKTNTELLMEQNVYQDGVRKHQVPEQHADKRAHILSVYKDQLKRAEDQSGDNRQRLIEQANHYLLTHDPQLFQSVVMRGQPSQPSQPSQPEEKLDVKQHRGLGLSPDQHAEIAIRNIIERYEELNQLEQQRVRGASTVRSLITVFDNLLHKDVLDENEINMVENKVNQVERDINDITNHSITKEQSDYFKSIISSLEQNLNFVKHGTMDDIRNVRSQVDNKLMEEKRRSFNTSNYRLQFPQRHRRLERLDREREIRQMSIPQYIQFIIPEQEEKEVEIISQDLANIIGDNSFSTDQYGGIFQIAVDSIGPDIQDFLPDLSNMLYIDILQGESVLDSDQLGILYQYYKNESERMTERERSEIMLDMFQIRYAMDTGGLYVPNEEMPAVLNAVQQARPEFFTPGGILKKRDVGNAVRSYKGTS